MVGGSAHASPAVVRVPVEVELVGVLPADRAVNDEDKVAGGEV